MLGAENAVLVVIDVQERLWRAMADRDVTAEQLGRLIPGVRALGVPILLTEQFPAKLGPTIAPLAALAETPAIPKTTFSCTDCPAFAEALERTGRRQVLLAGIESHVCVCQTALALCSQGYEVYVVADAITSRRATSRTVALQRMRDAGVQICTTEMALFEMLTEAEGPAFKTILRLVK